MSSRFDAFLDLSVELTAFSRFDLLGAGLAELSTRSTRWSGARSPTRCSPPFVTLPHPFSSTSVHQRQKT
ncbi:hypothetical protein [Rhizobium ruizarguesonis]|uniref:hypothetical protein n=1 Tax=Rhizobium ruizarguesonis TaxID=2081791 RepID=UPI000AC1A465